MIVRVCITLGSCVRCINPLKYYVRIPFVSRVRGKARKVLCCREACKCWLVKWQVFVGCKYFGALIFSTVIKGE